MENQNIKYLLENVISKAKYNEKTKKYEIKEEDYITLNLSTQKFKLLKRICEIQNIDLEYIGYTRMILPCVENEELFKRYNEIKSILETTTNHKLEEERINIRNKIIKDNLPFITEIIIRRVDNHKKVELEELYQNAYLFLLEYIDNNYLQKNKFKNDISSTIIINIKRKCFYEQTGISKYQQEKIQNNPNDENSDIESSNLNNLLSTLSLDIIITDLQTSTNKNEEPLENQLIDKYSKEDIVSKIISTLHITEQKIIKLYFGIGYEKNYNLVEIAKMYGVTKSYISAVLNKALETIKTTIRIKYLIEVYEKEYDYQLDKHKNKKLEDYLLKYLPPKLIEQILKELANKKEKIFFEIYTKKTEYEMQEISQELNWSLPYLYQIKNKALLNVRDIIMNKLLKENKTYEEYLEYLMQLYLKKPKTKKRGK